MDLTSDFDEFIASLIAASRGMPTSTRCDRERTSKSRSGGPQTPHGPGGGGVLTSWRHWGSRAISRSAVR